MKSLFYFAKEKNKTSAIKLAMEVPSVLQVSHHIEKKNIKLKLKTLPIWFAEFL